MSTNATWETSESFEYSLLSGTWKQAENNLDSIFKNYSEFKTCLINEDDLLTFNCDGTDGDNKFDWDLWYEDFKGPFYYICVWLFFSLIFTVFGIVWCICNKCVCCCGGRRYKSQTYGLENTDPEFDTSGHHSGNKKKTIVICVLGVLMAFWTIGYAYSTVIAVASNEAIRSAINDLPDDARKPLNDADTYIVLTQQEIRYAFIDRFEELAQEIRNLVEFQKEGLPAEATQQIKTVDLVGLKDATDKLINELRRSKNEVHGNDNLMIDPVISKLESFLEFVSSYTDDNTSVDGKQGTPNPQLEEAIRKTRETLTGNADTLNDAIDELKVSVSDVRVEVDNAETDWLDIVRNSVYGTFMATNVIIILMFIGMILGSVIVWFVSDDGKNTGFILHRFTITTMFSIGWIIVFMMLSGFALAGGFSQIFCEGVRELENGNQTTRTQALGHFQSYLRFQNNADNYVLPSYSYIVQNLKKGNSAYQSFDLRQVYDAEEIRKISDNFIFNIRSELMPTEDNTEEANFTELQTTLNEVQNLLSTEMSSLRSNGWMIKLFNKIETEYGILSDTAKSARRNLEATRRQNSDAIIEAVEKYEDFVYLEITENIGKTRPLYDALQYGIDLVCYKVLVPVATYWWAFQFLLIMFVAFIITAFITERFFK